MRHLRAGQQMKVVAIRRHQPIEQRQIHAMQVLQRIHDRELRTKIELQSRMPDRSEIDQHHPPVRFLQRDGHVDSSRGCARATFGVDKSEHPGFAGTALGAAQRCGKACERFDQCLVAGRRSTNSRAPALMAETMMVGCTISPMAKIVRSGKVRMDQFDGAHRALSVPRIDIHQSDLGALVLQLTKYRVARPVRQAHMVQHRASHVRAFHARIQYDGLLAILGEDGDGDALHDSVLGVQGHATSFLRWGQVTIVIERTFS